MSTGSYFIVAPVGPSGIAFLGDQGEFVSLGQKRISQLADDGTVRATVEFARGEQAVTLHGYAPAAPTVTATGGAVDGLSYDAATQRFQFAVHPDAAPASVTVTPRLDTRVAMTQPPTGTEHRPLRCARSISSFSTFLGRPAIDGRGAVCGGAAAGCSGLPASVTSRRDRPVASPGGSTPIATAPPRTPVPTLDPSTEASAAWKTLVGVATVPNIFETPVGLAVDSLGVLYVADVTQHRLLRFNSVNGQFEGALGSPGTGPLQFQAPMGLAIDSQDNVYVAERGGNRIQKISPAGQFVSNFGEHGSQPGQFDAPFSVSVDSTDNLVVADARNNRVQKISPKTGELLANFGSLGQGKAQFNGPTSVGVGPFDNIYVADRGNNRIQIFDPQGSFIGAFGTPGDAATEFRLPAALAVSLSRGDLYVADTDNNRVVRYSPTSPDPVPMGQKGSGPDQFLSPGGVAIDRQGNVFVADTGNRRILRLAAPAR